MFAIMMWHFLNAFLSVNLVNGLLLQNLNFLDLSYLFNNKSLHWREDIPFINLIKYKGPRKQGNYTIWYQVEDINFSTHTATHLDAPCHLSRGMWGITDIPFEHLTDRPAAVLDITAKSNLHNGDYEATTQDIIDWEAVYGELPDGGVLVIQTGWGRFWPNLKKYGLKHGPGMAASAANWLVANRKLVGVGIEAPSVDVVYTTGKTGFPTKVALFNANLYAIDNMPGNVKKLPRTGATLTLMPMKLESACAAPLRIFANLCPRDKPCVLPS